ncbi:hypothetical protein AMTR_s00095p00153340 [Amborella trichopoda]|uniref:Uncharacterized protein n=1 Tax=Amborella trichopoda TaxID=13333 RepID=W1NR06_AMBTC|nr:hypothetical protein AMTR_s00095p00153340 [Amborella trichopoda]
MGSSTVSQHLVSEENRHHCQKRSLRGEQHINILKLKELRDCQRNTIERFRHRSRLSRCRLRGRPLRHHQADGSEVGAEYHWGRQTNIRAEEGCSRFFYCGRKEERLERLGKRSESEQWRRNERRGFHSMIWR